jgi:hypothetical protein
VGAAAVAAFVVPIPVVVTAPLVVEPVGAQDAYVTTAGRLTAVRVRPGQWVRKGDVLVELADRAAADSFRDLQASYEAQSVAVTVAQATGDAAQEATAVKTRQALFEELAESRGRLSRLAVTAPCDGTVIAPPPSKSGGRSEDRLGQMTGTPLDRSNAGAWLPIGTHVATVAPGGAYQAVLLVDQFSRADFAPGRRVRIKLEHAPDRVIRGVIESRSAPAEARLLASDKFAAEKRAASRELGAKAPKLSQMSVRLESPDPPMLAGLLGEARAVVFRASLANCLWRQARLTFSFL